MFECFDDGIYSSSFKHLGVNKLTELETKGLIIKVYNKKLIDRSIIYFHKICCDAISV